MTRAGAQGSEPAPACGQRKRRNCHTELMKLTNLPSGLGSAGNELNPFDKNRKNHAKTASPVTVCYTLWPCIPPVRGLDLQTKAHVRADTESWTLTDKAVKEACHAQNFHGF